MPEGRISVEFETDPLFRYLSRWQALCIAYISGPILVIATTLGLWEIQNYLAVEEHLTYVRPYGIGYLAPVMVAAIIGGRGPGMLTLALSEFGLVGILMQPHQPAFMHTPRDWAEMIVLPLAGVLVVLGIEALRNNTRLLYESQAAEARTQAIMSSAPVGVAILNQQGEIQFANREIDRIWGRPLTAKSLEVLVARSLYTGAGELIPFDDCPLGRVLRGAVISEARELMMEQPDGSRIWIEQRAAMVHDNKRRLQGALMILSDITERKGSEIKLRARVQREALMNRIAVAIRAADAPESIQHTAVMALGKALGLDRCYFMNLDEDVVIAPDYHAPELPSLAGSYPYSSFPADMLALYAGHCSLRLSDIHADKMLSTSAIAMLEKRPIRAMIGVPIYENDEVVALLIAAMSYAPRMWTDDELDLVEIVAAQARTAVESARLRLREHRIATTLQDALRPALPKSVPGLDIASFYRAALEEASIGGDFLDIFPLDSKKHCDSYAILVGDVSGKGLAAASQVATVRMMLRYALTSGGDMPRALQHLNDTLSTRDWLIGFATLFVGIYDSTAQTLRYISCGHEPAMLRRARSGRVEDLPATGGAMGAYEGAVYEEREVLLHPGDEILLYTDGVSDIGPDRAHALGDHGVARIIHNAPRDLDASKMMSHILTEVDLYSGGQVRDDICMLTVKVVSENPTSDLLDTNLHQPATVA